METVATEGKAVRKRGVWGPVSKQQIQTGCIHNERTDLTKENQTKPNSRDANSEARAGTGKIPISLFNRPRHEQDTSRTPAVDGHYAEKLEIDESIWEQSPRTTLM